MSGTILLNLYHIFYILLAVVTVVGIAFRFLLIKLRSEWSKDFEAKMLEVNKKVSDEHVRKLASDECDTKVTIVERDLGEIKDMLKKLQESMFVIHTTITEMKPRVENLEKRVDRLENKLE